MVGGTWVCCGAMHIYFSRHRTLFFPERLYKLGCTLLHVTTLPLLPASPTLHERAFVRWRFIARTFSFNEVIDQRCLVCSIGFFPFVLLSTISRRPPDRVCARFRSASSLQKLPYRNNYQKQIKYNLLSSDQKKYQKIGLHISDPEYRQNLFSRNLRPHPRTRSYQGINRRSRRGQATYGSCSYWDSDQLASYFLCHLLPSHYIICPRVATHEILSSASESLFDGLCKMLSLQNFSMLIDDASTWSPPSAPVLHTLTTSFQSEVSNLLRRDRKIERKKESLGKKKRVCVSTRERLWGEKAREKDNEKKKT